MVNSKFWKILFLLLFWSIATEVLVRLFLPYHLIEEVVPVKVGKFDSHLGWALNENTKAFSKRTGVCVEYSINSVGMRDDEVSLVKKKNVFRIALYGDSNTFGYGVPIEKHFSKLLEGYFENVEVINMGVSGYGIDQMILTYQLKGVLYKPNLVIVYLPHFGDHRHMHSVRWGNEKPLYKIENDCLVLTNFPVLLKKKSLNKQVITAHKKIRYYWKSYSMIANVVSKLFFTNPKAEEYVNDKKNGENEAFITNMVNLAEEIILKGKENALSNGTEFLVVTRMQEFHNRLMARGIRSLDVSYQLSNPMFKLPDELEHINEPGNGVLAYEIRNALKIMNLINENSSTE